MMVSSDLDSDDWISKLVWLGKLKEEEDERKKNRKSCREWGEIRMRVLKKRD